MDIKLIGIVKGSRVAVWVEPYPKHHSRKYNHENTPKFTSDPLINTVSEDSTFNFTVPGFEWNQHIIVLRVRHQHCRPIEMMLDATDLIETEMTVIIKQQMDFYDWPTPKPPKPPRTIIGPYGMPFVIPGEWT